MADELTLDTQLAYTDSEGTEDSLSIAGLEIDVTTKRIAHIKMSVAITEVAMDLGQVTSLGYVLIVNRDTTNFVQLLRATASTAIIKLRAGEVALFRFGSGVTAPFLIADTASCQVEYILISA